MTSPAPESAIGPSVKQDVGQRTVRRIDYLIPAFGGLGVLTALIFHRLDWAEGLLAGSALAWFNFRWLKRGVQAFTSLQAAQSSGRKSRGNFVSYFAAAFRYILIGAAMYVIFSYLHVPLLSMALGLCAFVAATLAASVWEILQSVK